MNPSFGPDIRTSLGQSAPPQLPAPSRPHSIAELAERAKQSVGYDVRPFKTWLRIAENARRDARSFNEQGDLDSAFVEYAKAATIVLEKIPSHPDYRVLLSTTQRHNMGLVSYFYSLGPHTCASVGQVHVPYECIKECISAWLSLIQNSCDACDSHQVISSRTSIPSRWLLSPLVIRTWRQTIASASWNEWLLRSVHCR
jgi:hypothetical protein